MKVEQQIKKVADLALFEIMTRYRPELFCCESMEDILHELEKEDIRQMESLREATRRLSRIA